MKIHFTEVNSLEKKQISVVLVRPHVIIEHGNDAIPDIASYYSADPGLRIIKQLRFTFTRKKAEEFYAEHKGKFFFENLMDTSTEGESVAFLIEGFNAVEKVRRITGPTDSRKNLDETTVRGKYGIKVAPEETDPGSKNGAHASDSAASAMREEKIIWGSIKGL